MKNNILEVSNLNVIYGQNRGWSLAGGQDTFHAVKDVSFSVSKGDTLGIVGESGSGKSSLVRAVLRAVEPASGRSLFQSQSGEVDLTTLPHKDLVPLRREMRMIFQDPFSSLNPRMKVGDIVAEPLTIHLGYKRQHL